MKKTAPSNNFLGFAINNSKLIFTLPLFLLTLLFIFQLTFITSQSLQVSADLSCDAGFTLVGSSCVRTVDKTCVNGGVLQDSGVCFRNESLVYNAPANGIPQQNFSVTAATPGWTLVPGTIVNDGIDSTNTVVLDDSLYNNATGVLTASPTAGYFGNPTTDSVGTLNVGKWDFIHSCWREQFNNFAVDDATLILNNNPTLIQSNATCQFNNTNGNRIYPEYDGTPARTTSITNQRYIHSCATIQNTIDDSADGAFLVANNNPSLIQNNANCLTGISRNIAPNAAGNPAISYDMLNSRYLHVCFRQQVNQIGYDGAWIVVNNNPTLTQTNANCNLNPPSNILVDSAIGNPAKTFDLYNPAADQDGSISYTIQQPAACPNGVADPSNLRLCIETFQATDTPTIIDINNILDSNNCTSVQTVTIPNTYNCIFPLNGSSTNNYVLPNGGITAGTSTALGNSPACTISNNQTASAALVCNSIPTTNGNIGNQDVTLRIAQGTPFKRGEVVLIAPVVTTSSIQRPVATLTRTGGDNNTAMIIGFIATFAMLSAISLLFEKKEIVE